MSEAVYRLRILTNEGLFHEGDVVSLVAPGESGYFGVLASHAPLVAACVPGKLYFREPGGLARNFTVGKGFLEVLKNRVTLITEKITEAEKAPL